MHRVALVQAVDLASLLDLHVPVHQDELADRLAIRESRFVSRDPAANTKKTPEIHKRTDRVEHEAVDSVAGVEHDHGGAAVEGVARRHQVPARLQGVLLARLVVRRLGGKKTYNLLSVHSLTTEILSVLTFKNFSVCKNL